jgi:hypothetical protein
MTIIYLEHVNININVDEVEKGMCFYREGLQGSEASRDIWVNFFNQQMHLPRVEGPSQVIDGEIELTVESMDDLVAVFESLSKLRERLADTKFNCTLLEDEKQVVAICPFGNTFRIIIEHVPQITKKIRSIPNFKSSWITSIKSVTRRLPRHHRDKTVAFFKDIMKTPVLEHEHKISVVIKNPVDIIDRLQYIHFEFVDEETIPYDYYHIAIYLSEATYDEIKELVLKRDLLYITTRFQDPDTQFRTMILATDRSDEDVSSLELEIRSINHHAYPLHLLG